MITWFAVRDKTIQWHLLAGPDCKLSKAILLVCTAEEAAAKTEELQHSKANCMVDVNQLQKSGKLPGTMGPASAPVQPCWHCAGEQDSKLARTLQLSATAAATRSTSRKPVGRKKRKKSKLSSPITARDTPRKSCNIVDATSHFGVP